MWENKHFASQRKEMTLSIMTEKVASDMGLQSLTHIQQFLDTSYSSSNSKTSMVRVLGPVDQSIISLTSSLLDKMFTVLRD